MIHNISIRAFIAGSAFPVIIFPMLYLGIPSVLYPDADFNFFTHILSIPILVGLINIMFVNLKQYLPSGTTKYWLWGAGHGLVFTLIGNFSSEIPTELFMLDRPLAFITIPLAMILYSLIWRYVIRGINTMMDID